MTSGLRRDIGLLARLRSRPGAAPTAATIWRFDEVRSDDVYLISFPRSGNTWLRYLLATLLYGPETDPDRVAATVPDVHKSDPAIRPGPGPIWVKSHMPASEGPLPARVVYLVRNGLDATASYHRYLRHRGRLAPDDSLDEFLERPDMWPCLWAVHVDGWFDAIEARPESDALLVRYEDLVDRPVDELERVVDFLGIDSGPGQIEEAVALATRSRMREDEAQAGRGSLNHVGVGADRTPSGPAVDRFLSKARSTLLRAGYHPS